MTQQTQEKPRLDMQRALPVFVLTLVDILGLTIILPLLHLFAAAFGATPLEIGLVAAAFPLSQLIGVPLMGALSDRYGRKPLLLISQVTTFISFVMLALSNSLWMVILSRVVDGLFGANISTAQAALTDITDDDTRSQGLGLIGAAFGIGFVLGPIISIVALEVSDSLFSAAVIAAVYSFASILLTLFVFKETLPPERRDRTRSLSPFVGWGMIRRPGINVLLVMMFAQQVIFYGFEALLGLFLLSRLGLLGQGTGIVFIVVGVTLVIVQVRFIGAWNRRLGDKGLVLLALGMLAAGLLLTALTPEQPHPFYVREIVENTLSEQRPTSAEAIRGDAVNIDLPENEDRGAAGVIWLLVAIIPVSIGAGLIRPSLNSLMTKRVGKDEYGRVLGVSASFVSAANAVSPLIGAALFQFGGSSLPFLLGGVVMTVLLGVGWVAIRP